MPPRRPRSLSWGRIALPALLLCALAWAFAAQAQAALDVRVVVDVSRSARHADPGAERVAMLRLLIDLLPAGSRAGIWAYGERVEVLAPPGTVTTAWRDTANRAVAHIDTLAAPYADLAAGLHVATESWRSGIPVPAERHVILLGNGHIDVPGDAEAVEAARDRIVRELLPGLQEAGATLHGIALSSTANHALLAQLTAATGGQRASIDDAESPESTLLRVFEQSMRPLLLPVRSGEIQVDGDVSELAVLALSRPGVPALRLLAPDGSEPESVYRRRESGYELAVIAQPAPGAWRLEGPAEQDVRALIVSDLGLAAGPLPARVLAGKDLELRTGVLAYGRVVDRKALHHALRMEVAYPSPDGASRHAMLLDNGRDGDAVAGDGVYTLRLATGLPEGRHDVTVEADGTIFRRSRRLPVEATASPAATVFEHTEHGATLYILPYAGLVQPDSLQAAVTVTTGGVHVGRYDAERRAPNEWRVDFSDIAGPGPHELALEISAEDLQGGALHYQEAPRRFGPAGFDAPLAAEAAPAEGTAQAGSERRRLGLAIMVGNVALGALLLLGIAFRRLPTRRSAPARALPATASVPVSASAIAAQVAAAEAAPVSAPLDTPAIETVAEMEPLVTAAEEPDTSAPTSMDADTVMAEIAADAAAAENTGLREKVERATRSANASALSGDPLVEIDISDIDLDFDEAVSEAV